MVSAGSAEGDNGRKPTKNIVNNTYRGKIMVEIQVQDLHCNSIGSPGMVDLIGRRGITRDDLFSWGGIALDRTRKVGKDVKAPLTSVCARYNPFEILWLAVTAHSKYRLRRTDQGMAYPIAVTCVNPGPDQVSIICSSIRGSRLRTSINICEISLRLDSEVNDMGFYLGSRSCGQCVVGRKFTITGGVGWPRQESSGIS
jgi:hypothetical protein